MIKNGHKWVNNFVILFSLYMWQHGHVIRMTCAGKFFVLEIENTQNFILPAFAAIDLTKIGGGLILNCILGIV